MAMLGTSAVDVSTWVRINGEVDIEYEVYEDGDVELTLGDCDKLGFSLTAEGLEALVREVGAALAASHEVLLRGEE